VSHAAVGTGAGTLKQEEQTSVTGVDGNAGSTSGVVPPWYRGTTSAMDAPVASAGKPVRLSTPPTMTPQRMPVAVE
jgi:hypothetical protein